MRGLVGNFQIFWYMILRIWRKSALFDMTDGDLITGLIMLDSLLLCNTVFSEFHPTDPDLDCSFAFGNILIGKNDHDTDGET